MPHDLIVERLESLLTYSPETGEWRWRVSPNNGCTRAGSIAGHISRFGYRRIRIDGRNYFSAPLACLYMTGRWPVAEMDHIDLDRSNDRWANLREATVSQNKANRRRFKTSASPLKGTTFYASRNKWRAQIYRDGQCRFLGHFDTAEEAHAAYRDAALAEHGEFARFD
jgi:hypothetical protein